MTNVIDSSSILDKIQELGASVDRILAYDNARLYRGSRSSVGLVPMIMTTDYQISLNNSKDSKYILFWAGSQNTVWSFKQRGAQQQSRTGHIFHYWRDDKRETFFDDPTVTFTFQSGNIMPLRITSTDSVVALPPGLLDYYDFFYFLDEKKILSDGRPNYINIIYHSLLYPAILLRGFFEPETGFSITESADNPAQFTWSSTFRIRDSNPRFYNAEELKKAWVSANTNYSTLLPAIETSADLTIPDFNEPNLIAQKNRDEVIFAILEAEAAAAEQARLNDQTSLVDLITGD